MSDLADIHALADAAAARLGTGEPFAPPPGAWTEGVAKPRFVAGVQASVRLTGDGAATSVVLTRALLARALQHVAAGGDAMALKAELEAALTPALEAVLAEARPLNELADLRRVVHLASRTEADYAGKIAVAAKLLGAGGSLTIAPAGDYVVTRVVHDGGISFEEAWASPWFATSTDPLEAVLANPYVLVVDGDMADGAALAPILGKVAQTGRPLLIVGGELGEDALNMLVINRLSGACQVSAGRAPGFGSLRSAVLSDIAVVTGAKVVKPDAVARAGLGDLGQAVEARQDQYTTAIICDDAAKDRGRALSDRLTDEGTEVAKKGDSYSLSQLHARIKRLDRGVGVIHLAPEEDPGPIAREAASAAAFAVVEEGVVVGGGGPLVRAGATLPAGAGARMLAEAMAEPCRWIARNAGVDDDAAVQASLNARSEFGFNAATGRFENLRTAGIVDLAMTLRWVLRTAVGTTTALMRDEGLVAEARSLKRTGLPPASGLRPPAAAPGAVRDPAAEARAPDATLMLLEGGDRHITVMREVMALNPGMGIGAGMALLKSLPQPIKSGLRPAEAERLRDKFVDLGAQVEIR
jgi:chaperonin GroEL